METKKINETYYASVIRRYMTSHLGEDLEESTAVQVAQDHRKC